MKSRKSAAIKRNNQANNSVVTQEITMSPGILSPRDKRINVRIPENAKLFKYLSGDNPEDKRPTWQQLDAIFEIAEKNIEEFTIKIYDEFVVRTSVFYPEKVQQLNKLRPLIIKHILKGDPLDESYYEMIREL